MVVGLRIPARSEGLPASLLLLPEKVVHTEKHAYPFEIITALH
ncbi:MAG: hypothetical protein A4E42_02105 [Methanoregulaceae archaeon PtaU1.Bin222]|nr:MAG: hypothetical protein A4E42_02105 [Methanoregulaceae archaeon PtaU1.Bin222]